MTPAYKDNHTTIYQGDCRDALQHLPDDYVHTCVTSPPYYGLRDYGQDGQIGLEESVEKYVNTLCDVFDGVYNVLREDGTLWLNLGDSYTGNCSRTSTGRAGYGNEREGIFTRQVDGLKNKELIGVPWRVAFELQKRGWYLRQDIIWHKPNPLPESVKDRCTKAHEYIFLLTKSDKYYYDYESVLEPADYDGRHDTVHKGSEKYREGSHMNNQNAQSLSTRPRERWKEDADGNKVRNKRSVWTVATQSYKGAHFATFPQDLIVPCILAGCPENGVVLDPFGGAGTTAVVAKQHNRKSVLVELNPEYVELQKERLQQQMFNFDEATTEERQPPLLFGEEVPEESEKAQA